MKMREIIDVMEMIAPPELAEEWDNPGLMVGMQNQEIKKVLVSLDLNMEVVEEATENDVDLVITHHPLIFHPLKRIDNPVLIKLIQRNICVYSAHTNLDAAQGGVNDALAAALHLKQVQAEGMLRYGKIEPISLSEWEKSVREHLQVSALRVSGDPETVISQVAVLGGSGGGFVQQASQLGCDVLVTGEASYHHAQQAQELGIALIAAGHYETETVVVPNLADRLKLMLQGVSVLESHQGNPFPIRF